MAIPLAVTMIPAGLQAIAGGVQLAKGIKQRNENERPLYEIPPAVLQAIQNAKVGASSFEMAGQTGMEQNQDQILANTTGQITDTATSSAEALSALVRAGGQRMAAQNQIGIAAEQNYERNQDELRAALFNLGDYQDKAFELNEMQPYQDKAASASALIGGGMQNLFGAANTATGIMANKGIEDFYKSLNQPQDKVTSLLNQVATTPNDTTKELDMGLLSPESNTFFKGLSTPFNKALPNMGNSYNNPMSMFKGWQPYQPKPEQVYPEQPQMFQFNSNSFYNPQ
jgi:hypothetical protein